MKRIIVPLAFVGIMITSCATDKFLMSTSEINEKGYSIEGWDIFQKGKLIGTLDNTEWELYKNDLRREISVTGVHHMADQDIRDLIRFIHTKYPDYKVEVNLDDTFKK